MSLQSSMLSSGSEATFGIRLGPTPKYYSAITPDIESGDRFSEKPELEPIGFWSEKFCFSTTNSEGCFAPGRVWTQLHNNIFQIKLFCIDKTRRFCINYQAYICIPLLCIILLFAIYVIIILIGLFCVLFDTIFEKTMIYLIGQTLYNKNFPICSNTMYQGGDCYTTTNTYCR